MEFNSMLIVSDYDLTLTDLERRIPEANIRAIEEYIAGGGLFSIGTGRGINNALHFSAALPINAPCIFHNGAAIYDCSAEKIIRAKTFNLSFRKRLRELTDSLRGICGMLIECIEGDYAPAELNHEYPVLPGVLRIVPFDEIPEQPLMVVLTGTAEQTDAAQRIAEERGFCGTRSLPYTYDLQEEGVNKGSAAKELAALCGRDVLVCVGDAPNDIAMLDAADFAFVPESASDSMRSLGYRKAAHHDLGTLADVIRQLKSI